MAVEGAALRKRQQIAKANRMMFLWVAGVSAVVGIAVVASLFLVQKMAFNEKVLAEKSRTASTLEKNNGAVEELQNQIRKLNTNDSLRGNMVVTDKDAQPVQVVLDALPATANSSAFGASLQQRFLQVDGIRLEMLNVDPVPDAEVSFFGEDSSQSTDTALSEDSEDQYRVHFRFEVSTNKGNEAALKNLLVRLGRSIRPITLTNLSVEAQADSLTLKAEGHTYYRPARTVDLKDKVVTP